MRTQNDGISADDILQNQFTSCLITAVKLRKALYIRKKTHRQQVESPLELYDTEMPLQTESDLLIGFSLLEQIENPMLHPALMQAKENEKAAVEVLARLLVAENKAYFSGYPRTPAFSLPKCPHPLFWNIPKVLYIYWDSFTAYLRLRRSIIEIKNQMENNLLEVSNATAALKKSKKNSSKNNDFTI